jgi:hypothetical protein
MGQEVSQYLVTMGIRIRARHLLGYRPRGERGIKMIKVSCKTIQVEVNFWPFIWLVIALHS